MKTKTGTRLYNFFIKARCKHGQCKGNVIVQHWHTAGLATAIREAVCMLCGREYAPAVIMGSNNRPKYIARAVLPSKEANVWVPISI